MAQQTLINDYMKGKGINMSRSVNKTAQLLSAMGIFFCFCGVLMAVTDEYYNVKTDYGAVGNGTTNDTTAFQNALNAAAAAPGDKWVFVPAGTYLISTHLTIPVGVTLKGSWQFTPGSGATAVGATLLAVEGAGNPNGTAFIRMDSDSCIQGIKIRYPNQTSKTSDPFTPVQYPWTLDVFGANVKVLDCYVENPYQCLKITGTGRANVVGLCGQPLYKGIYVNYALDSCRFKNVHFYPFWSGANHGPSTWIANNGEAFVFGYARYQDMSNCYSYGYKYGFHFIPKPEDPYIGQACQGQFVNCDAILCGTAAVKVDECQIAYGGLRFVNGDFCVNERYSHSTTLESVTIGAETSGCVGFDNCSFWGPSSRICTINTGTSPGTATFTNCSFRDWDMAAEGKYAFAVLGGRVIVKGCYFITSGNCVSVASAALGATITANVGAASTEILNNAGTTKCQVANNVP
ncbi:MAG: glycosyl hydrolase family 28-related protein [Phycisphaerae bacterium]